MATLRMLPKFVAVYYDPGADGLSNVIPEAIAAATGPSIWLRAETIAIMATLTIGLAGLSARNWRLKCSKRASAREFVITSSFRRIVLCAGPTGSRRPGTGIKRDRGAGIICANRHSRDCTVALSPPLETVEVCAMIKESHYATRADKLSYFSRTMGPGQLQLSSYSPRHPSLSHPLSASCSE